MTLFRSSKGYHFSEDGTDKTAWAKFEHVRGSEPIVYEYDTSDKKHIAALRKLIDDRIEGYTDIVEVTEAEPLKRGGSRAGKASVTGAGATGGTQPGSDGGQGGTTGGAGSTGELNSGL